MGFDEYFGVLVQPLTAFFNVVLANSRNRWGESKRRKNNDRHQTIKL